MKIFFKKLIIFIIIIICIDFIFGVIIKKIIKSAIGGETAVEKYISDGANEDIIILGSSRASHHYIPQLFGDSLGLSCYNLGLDGNGIILMYGRIKMILNYHSPKFIIYDIFPPFDINIGDDNVKYLDRLKWHYSDSSINKIFQIVDKTETYKMNSHMYRYNSKILQIINDTYQYSDDHHKGYLPLYGIIDKFPQNNHKKERIPKDKIKLDFLEQLIIDIPKDCKLIFTISPYYFQQNEEYINPIKILCDKYKIPLLDFSCDPFFNENKNLFKDSYHLNNEGAIIYTNYVIKELIKHIE